MYRGTIKPYTIIQCCFKLFNWRINAFYLTSYIRKLKADKFDLILTDQIMPNMTGENLAKKIMQIRPEIPIVLCTGFTETITPEKARAMGFSELLLKPVVIHDLAEAIRRILDGKPKRANGQIKPHSLMNS